MKAAVLRPLADDDVSHAIDHYLEEAPHMVTAFRNALVDAVAHIEASPGTGSPRYQHLLGIPDLRCWLVRRFPYAIFYIERADHLDVLRVLHQASDIPAYLEH